MCVKFRGMLVVVCNFIDTLMIVSGVSAANADDASSTVEPVSRFPDLPFGDNSELLLLADPAHPSGSPVKNRSGRIIKKPFTCRNRWLSLGTHVTCSDFCAYRGEKESSMCLW